MATSVLQLQPEEQTLRKLTIAEYHKLVEVGVLHPKERVELLDGLLGPIKTFVSPGAK